MDLEFEEEEWENDNEFSQTDSGTVILLSVTSAVISGVILRMIDKAFFQTAT